MKFRDWFKLQYGALPATPRQRQAIISRLSNAMRDLAEAEKDLARIDNLEQSWRDALYGWNAREERK